MIINKKTKKIIGLIILVILVFNLHPKSQAQNDWSKMENLQKEYEKHETSLRAKLEKAGTTEKEIKVLDQEILKKQEEILDTEEKINTLQLIIDEKNREIEIIENSVERQKIMIAGAIRIIYQYEQISIFEALLKNQKLSDFLSSIEYSKELQGKLQELLSTLKETKRKLLEEKMLLEINRKELTSLQSTLDTQKQALILQKEAKNKLLKKTNKDVDTLTQKMTELEKQMFLLQSEGISIPLKKAITFAVQAEKRTGVRAALILAVIKQESNLGSNVGTGHYPEDMHPNHRDAFLDICRGLGLDPTEVRISKKPSSYPGWGGAMGPAQIMPNYWEFIAPQVSFLSGHNPPSPWNLEDAFTACGLILARNGADKKDYDNEFKAAGLYFAGGNWKNYEWYPKQVMAKAKIYQEMIETWR